MATSTKLSLRGDDAAAFHSLPMEQQVRISLMLDVFAAVEAAPHRERLSTWQAAVRSANASLALQGYPQSMAVKRMTNLMSEYRRKGGDWTVCIDLRKVRDWSMVERRRVDEVPEATVQWWKTLVEQFRGRQNCLNQAYRRAVAVWSLGEPIPGYEKTPPSADEGHPAGWSYSNFCRLCKRSKFVKVLARTGAKAAGNFAFHVPQSRVDVAVGEYFMLDDVWHDFKVKSTIKSRPMRLLELCAMDLRSAKKVCYGLKTESIDDETGARLRLQERDMRFLLAALFTLHGYRPQGTTLVGEKGTAVVRDDIQQVLSDATDGAIKFEASAIHNSPAFPGWFRARGGGNPRFKAALESSFNLAHNAMAMLAGQVGSNERVNAPEELFGREAADKALVKALTGIQLAPADMLMVKAPFMLASQASRLIDAIYAWLNDRKDHSLEGWEQSGLVTGEVRVDPRMAEWTPLYALASETQEQQTAMAALMQLPGCYRMRKLSPAEVWERDAQSLVRLPAHVLPRLIGRDLAVERKVNDHGSFLFQDTSVSAEPIRYVGIASNPRGHEVMLRDGETYLTFCNPFDPRYLLVCDAQGGYIGRCLRVERACRADDEGLHMAMGQAAHVNALRARAFLARHAAESDDRAADEAANAGLLTAATQLSEIAAEQQVRVQAVHDRIQNSGDLGDIFGKADEAEDDVYNDDQVQAAESLASII